MAVAPGASARFSSLPLPDRLISKPPFVRLPLRDYTGGSCTEAPPLAKPNYSFEKRQREIAKKKEKDEKDARKREARDAAKQAAGSGDAKTDDSDTPPAAG